MPGPRAPALRPHRYSHSRTAVKQNQPDTATYPKAALCIRPLKTGAVTVWPDKISSDSLLAEWLQWPNRIDRLLSSAAPLDSRWAGAVVHHQYPGKGFLRRRRIRLEYSCCRIHPLPRRLPLPTGDAEGPRAGRGPSQPIARTEPGKLRAGCGDFGSTSGSGAVGNYRPLPPRRVLGSGCSQYFSDATGSAGSARAWSRLRTCRSAFAEVAWSRVFVSLISFHLSHTGFWGSRVLGGPGETFR